MSNDEWTVTVDDCDSVFAIKDIEEIFELLGIKIINKSPMEKLQEALYERSKK